MSSRILPKFELCLPQNIQELLEDLKTFGDNAAILAGGTDLLVRMKSGSMSPDVVISLANIDGLDTIEYDETKGLSIGAMATVNQVTASEVVKTKYPALFQSACVNGTAQTRNVATVVGNLLNASPAGDCACAILSLGGYVVLEGPNGRRRVDIDDFWTGYRQTRRKTDEFALEVVIPPPGKSVSAFDALTRTKKDLSKINAAATVVMDKGICQKARLAMGAVAPTLIRLKKCEKLMEGRAVDDSLIETLLELAPTEIAPIDDVRSSAEYRKDVSGVLIARVIKKALGIATKKGS